MRYNSADMAWSNPLLGSDFGKLNIWFHSYYGFPDMYVRISVAERYGEATATLCEFEMAENGWYSGCL